MDRRTQFVEEKDASTQTGAKKAEQEDILQVELEVIPKKLVDKILCFYRCTTGCNSGQQVPSRLVLVPGAGRHLLQQAVGGACQGGEEERGEQLGERQEPPRHLAEAKPGRHPQA